jgi:hypothetical protein
MTGPHPNTLQWETRAPEGEPTLLSAGPDASKWSAVDQGGGGVAYEL